MSEHKTVVSGGTSTGSLLLVLFVALKLTGVIAWSWWWVLSPLWIPLLIALVIFAVLAIGAAIAVAWDEYVNS